MLAGTAANDGLIERDSHNIAPALSNDGSTVYVVVKWSTNARYGYLLGLDSTTLSTKYSVFLRDPRNGNPAEISEDGTSSPMVAPDGDVYFGVRANPNNGSRGFLLRFSGDLSITKTPGAFGWDYTPGIVPASLVPSYTGSSSYLLFCKYNDYPFQDGSGVNRVALLDPNSTQIDPHSSAPGLVEMREVLTVIAPTRDTEQPDAPNAVKEWCINAPAVNPATNSVFFNSEDGHAYRWNLATNSLDQAIILNEGIGQPYVPTVIGPDGTVYTLNGGGLFALGNQPDLNFRLVSSAPDSRETIFGGSVTFTATITGSPNPTGTVTFFDVTYKDLNPETTTLASNVPLNGSGQAAVTTSALTAGGNYLGNHFITALYSGDANHASAFVALVQKGPRQRVDHRSRRYAESVRPGPISFLDGNRSGRSVRLRNADGDGYISRRRDGHRSGAAGCQWYRRNHKIEFLFRQSRHLGGVRLRHPVCGEQWLKHAARQPAKRATERLNLQRY